MKEIHNQFTLPAHTQKYFQDGGFRHICWLHRHVVSKFVSAYFLDGRMGPLTKPLCIIERLPSIHPAVHPSTLPFLTPLIYFFHLNSAPVTALVSSTSSVLLPFWFSTWSQNALHLLTALLPSGICKQVSSCCTPLVFHVGSITVHSGRTQSPTHNFYIPEYATYCTVYWRRRIHMWFSYIVVKL